MFQPVRATVPARAARTGVPTGTAQSTPACGYRPRDAPKPDVNRPFTGRTRPPEAYPGNRPVLDMYSRPANPTGARNLLVASLFSTYSAECTAPAGCYFALGPVHPPRA